MAERVLRMSEVAGRLGVSRVTVHRWVQDGKLPPKRRLGANSVGILERDLDDWLRSRPVVGAEGVGDGDAE